MNATIATSLFLAGIDEAGRGPLAGPVTAACVCLPPKYKNKRICDSKQLSAQNRDELFGEIADCALAFSAVSVGPKRIDRLNILAATKLAMCLAAARVTKLLQTRNTSAQVFFLIDGNASPATTLHHDTIIKGDQKILAIAAASIIAKVTRDRLMERLESFYPGYGFEEHKGYGTELHRSRIAEHGPCRAHRHSFAGVREFVPGYVESPFVQESLFAAAAAPRSERRTSPSSRPQR
ncbi:MAG: ribonuclease HII [Bdellovibrionota bacterium]